MPVRIMIAAIVAALVIYSPVRAGGSSPSPTGSRSGTLIQTDVFPDSNSIAILRTDRNKYARSRVAMSRAARDFQTVAGQLKDKINPKHRVQLNFSLRAYKRASKTIGSMVNKSLVKGNPGNKLTSVAFGFIRFDGVDGRTVAEIHKIATELRSIEQKLGLLEPVVYR